VDDALSNEVRDRRPERRRCDVCRRDEEVDMLNRLVIDELYEVMRAHSDQIEPALHLFSISRHVERIADCATNIAEDVIYLVEGEIARHHAERTRKHLA